MRTISCQSKSSEMSSVGTHTDTHDVCVLGGSLTTLNREVLTVFRLSLFPPIRPSRDPDLRVPMRERAHPRRHSSGVNDPLCLMQPAHARVCGEIMRRYWKTINSRRKQGSVVCKSAIFESERAEKESVQPQFMAG